MKKGKSTGSEYAGTLGSASHRFEVFYCLLLGNASAVVVLPSRHVKYTVSIYKKKEKACGLLFFGGGGGGVGKEAFAVSEKVHDFSSACWPDGIIMMFSPQKNWNFFPQRKKIDSKKRLQAHWHFFQLTTAGSFTISLHFVINFLDRVHSRTI